MNRNRITSVEENGDDIIVKGILDDGTVDEDGQRIDPAWLREAAATWLAASPNVTVGRDPVGVGTEITADGDTTKITVRCDVTLMRPVIKGVIRGFSIGITQPVIRSDSVAPMGVIEGGKLVHVGLVAD